MSLKDKKQQAETYLQQLQEQHVQVSNAIQQVIGRIQTYDELLNEQEEAVADTVDNAAE